MFRIIFSEFNKRKELQRVAFNSSWIMFDNIFRILGGFLIGLWVARYLGPERYGQLSYAMYFVGLFGILATSSFNDIVVRRILENPEKKYQVMGSAFFIKLISAILATITIIVGIQFIHQEPIVKAMIVIYVTTVFFQSLDVIMYWFQSHLRSKYSVIAKNFAFVIVILSKLLLVILKADLVWFALVGAMEYLLLSIALVVAYKIDGQSILKWEFNINEIREMFRESIPVIVAAVFITVYIKLDKILVGTMLDKVSLGYYAVGTQLSDAWIFVPAALATSFYPTIIKSRNFTDRIYQRRLQLIYGFMTYVGIFIALPVSFFSKQIIGLLYGAEYAEAASVLAIYTWVLVPQCLNAIVFKWMFAEKLQKYLPYKALMAAIASVVLNILLIPRFGIIGASIASLIAILISTVFSNLVFKPLRKAFLMQLKSILAPIHFFNLYRELVSENNNSK